MREQGLEVIDAPAVSANCRSTSCEEDRLTASGASHVLFIEGSRNDYGFSLDITLRGVAGEDTEKAQGWCNFCTGPQMVTAAENVARPLVVHLAARPERVPGGVAAAPAASTGAAAEGNGGSGLARVLLGAGVAAVGAAGIVAGSFTWHRAGTETDCFATRNGTDCAEVYGGKNLGIGMVVGGAILAGVGGYLMIFTGRRRTLRRAPAACPWRERSSVAAVGRGRVRAHARDDRVQPEVAEAGLLPRGRGLSVAYVQQGDKDVLLDGRLRR